MTGHVSNNLVAILLQLTANKTYTARGVIALTIEFRWSLHEERGIKIVIINIRRKNINAGRAVRISD